MSVVPTEKDREAARDAVDSVATGYHGGGLVTCNANRLFASVSQAIANAYAAGVRTRLDANLVVFTTKAEELRLAAHACQAPEAVEIISDALATAHAAGKAEVRESAEKTIQAVRDDYGTMKEQRDLAASAYTTTSAMYDKVTAAHQLFVAETDIKLDSLATIAEGLYQALRDIAFHPHNEYGVGGSIENVDGHRCAAEIARAALKAYEEREDKEQ